MLELLPPANARVILPAAKTCRIELQSGERADAVLRGKLFEDPSARVVVGDFVVARKHGGQWAVEDALPRRNEFVRKGLRKERQVLFANADRVLIVASLVNPATKPASIDRFLVAALRGGIPVWLVLTKTDLDENNARRKALQELYEAFNVTVLAVSNKTCEGMNKLSEKISEGITAVVGNSGVGKSSLLNNLIPGIDLEVRAVSEWSGKGTHTTTAAMMVNASEKSKLIDTPGMKNFVPYGITQENLVELFPDIQDLSAHCKFRDCRHVAEPECAVRAAIEKNTLAESRLQSYYRLLSEIPSF